MDYNVGSVYNEVSNYINGMASNGNVKNNTDSNNNATTQNKYVKGVGIANDTLSSTNGSGAFDKLMTLGLMSGGLGNSDNNTSSGTKGFSLIMASLLKAMGEKERQTQQGIAQNSKYNNNTNNLSNNTNNLSDVIVRTLDGVKSSNVISATGTSAERIEKAVADCSAKYGVDESLIKAIIKTESNFDPNAASSAGAKGLMQLMPCNIEHYGVTDPFNIEENIDAGTRHINDYLKTYNNDLNMALAAYNFGPGNMASRGISSSSDFYKLPTETKNYLEKINNLI